MSNDSLIPLKQIILSGFGRAYTNYLVGLIKGKPELFNDFMAIYLANEEPVSRRAAWAVDTYAEQYPEMLAPYLEIMVEALASFEHDGLKRHTLRMLSRSQLPKENLGKLINICFDLLVSVPEAPAIKVHCMEILYRVSETEPDLKKELADSIEWRMNEETAGFRARGRKILKDLYS
jgi:hypothetical protein